MWTIIIFSFMRGQTTALAMEKVEGFATEADADAAAALIRGVVPPSWGADEAQVKTVVVEVP